MLHIFYHCENNGNGSVSVRFHPTEAEAIIQDEAQDEGWGKSSVGKLVLKIENNELFYKTIKWKYDKYEILWIKLENVQ